MNYLELTMSTAYRDQHETALKRELLEERKLALVLDLDHTLLHTVMKYPPPGNLRAHSPTRPHKPAYHPRAPQHALPANQPVSAPDPRRSKSKVHNALQQQGSGEGGVVPDVGAEGDAGNRQPNDSSQAPTSGEADTSRDHCPVVEIDVAARGEGADAACTAATSDHKDSDASQLHDAAVPASIHGEGHNSSECRVATAPYQPDAPPSGAEAGGAHAAPKASTEHPPEGSESARNTLKRFRSAEESEVYVGDTQAVAVEPGNRLQAPREGSADSGVAQAASSLAPTQSQGETISAAGARQGSSTGEAGGGAGQHREDPGSDDPQDAARTPSGEFEFPAFWTKLRPGAREMLHALQVLSCYAFPSYATASCTVPAQNIEEL